MPIGKPPAVGGGGSTAACSDWPFVVVIRSDETECRRMTANGAVAALPGVGAFEFDAAKVNTVHDQTVRE